MDTPRSMFIALLAVVASGCATRPPQQFAASEAEYQRTIPTCTSEQQCRREWAAARLWVTGNCGAKIRRITDDRIENYDPGSYSYRFGKLACRVTKDPLPAGGYALHIAVGCWSPEFCKPADRWNPVIAFNRAVTAAGAKDNR